MGSLKVSNARTQGPYDYYWADSIPSPADATGSRAWTAGILTSLETPFPEDIMSRAIALACLLIVVTAPAQAQTRGAGGAAGAAAGSCDRECLRGFITQYLEAMVSHNPAAVPTAP